MRFKEYIEQVRLATIDFILNNYTNTEINEKIIRPNYTFGFWEDFIEDSFEKSYPVVSTCEIREYVGNRLKEGVDSLSFNDLWKSIPDFKYAGLFDSFDGEALKVQSIDFVFLIDGGTKWQKAHVELEVPDCMVNVFEWDDNYSDAILQDSVEVDGTEYYCQVGYLLENRKLSVTLVPTDTDGIDWDWEKSLSNGNGFKLGDEVTFNLTNGDKITYEK